jgi:flagellin-like protein
MIKKKAEMGIGTLILFIAMLIVAAVAAGVLIQTSSSLQESSLSTGNQAKSQISTYAEVVDVSATDGRLGYLNYFQSILKLAPGSDPIKLDQVIFIFNTNYRTSVLKYRGVNSICERNHENGFATFDYDDFSGLSIGVSNIFTAGNPPVLGPSEAETINLEVDLDLDGQVDRLRTCYNTQTLCDIAYRDGTYLQFNLSNNGNRNIFYVRMYNDDGSLVDLSSSGPGDIYNFSNLEIIDNNGIYYGFLKGLGTLDPVAGNFYSNHVTYFEVFRPSILSSDLNEDEVEDFFVFNNTHIMFYLDNEIISIPFGTNILTTPTSVYFNNEPIELNGEILGYINIDSAVTTPGLISGTISINPLNAGIGYFSAIYETRATNFRNGYFQRGDIIKICFESFGDVVETENIKLSFIPKIGSSTLTIMDVPDVLNEEKVYLLY